MRQPFAVSHAFAAAAVRTRAEQPPAAMEQEPWILLRRVGACRAPLASEPRRGFAKMTTSGAGGIQTSIKGEAVRCEEPRLIRERWQRRRQPFQVWVGRVAATMMMLAPVGGLDRARAQAVVPSIEVANTILAEPATVIPFPIRVGPARAIPRNSFVRVRGLPPMAALTEGYSIGPGSWAVPLQALTDLKVTLPVATGGPANVTVSLVTIDGSVLAEVRTTLIVSSPPRSNSPPPLGAPTPASEVRA